ncbi:hypothetical protein C0J52_04156 [Blattella germanica]|nr:hypothetical protein C0J52_04156 [Blattella germanica]
MQSATLQIFVVCFFVLTQANGFLADESREEVRIATNNFPITGLKDDVSVRNSTNLKVWIQKPPNPERSYSAMKHVCGFIPQVYVVADLKSGHPLLKYRVTTLCCPGYKKDENDNCKPHCEDGCGEGFCARPGTCLCPNIHCAFNINSKPLCILILLCYFL